jgi:hypothetical protein
MEEATGRLSETARLTATPPASFYQSLVTLRDQSGPGLRKRQRRVRNLVADPLPRAAGSRFLRWSSLVNPRNAEPLPRGRRRERCAEAAQGSVYAAEGPEFWGRLPLPWAAEHRTSRIESGCEGGRGTARAPKPERRALTPSRPTRFIHPTTETCQPKNATQEIAVNLARAEADLIP